MPLHIAPHALKSDQVTISCGGVADSSEPKMLYASLTFGFFSTSVTTFRPAANSACRKLVRSISYAALVVLVTVNEPRTVVPAAGLLFQVSPESLHDVLE